MAESLSPRKTARSVSQKSLSHSPVIAYAAPPLRARPVMLSLGMIWDVVVAARGGLCGGDGIPWRGQSVTLFLYRRGREEKREVQHTELTSGTPIDPGSPRSGIMKPLKQRRSRIYTVAAGAHIGLDMAVVVVVAVITTTTIIITGGNSRHCWILPRLL